MNRRKLVIAKGMTVLALLAALVLAGCGGGQPQGSDAKAAEQARASANTKSSQSSRADSQGKASTDVPKPSEEGREKSMTNDSSSGSGSSGAMAGPVGDMIEIRKPWAQIRTAAQKDSAAVGVVYGNDTLEVIEQKGDWVRVKFGRNQKGWVHIEATQE